MAAIRVNNLKLYYISKWEVGDDASQRDAGFSSDNNTFQVASVLQLY